MSDNKRYKIIRNTSYISATVNTLLAVLKVTIGIIGHSKVLLADGLHSLSDTIADGIVLVAAKMGAKKADDDHPYGHHRIETLACIIIAFILLIMGGALIYWAATSLKNHHLLKTPSQIVIVVAFISTITNYGLYLYTRQKSKLTHSALLLSNALHNKADAQSSLIVVFSVVGAHLGWNFLDPIGAIIIAILIIKNGAELIKQGIDELIDTAVDPKTYQAIQSTIQATPGVMASHQIRTRLHSGHILVDCHILVEPRITVSEGHFIGDQVRDSLIKQNPSITDVTVHIDPEDDDHHATCVDKLPTRQLIETQLKQQLPEDLQPLETKSIHIDYLDNALFIQIILPLSILQRIPIERIEQDCRQAENAVEFVSTITLLFKP